MTWKVLLTAGLFIFAATAHAHEARCEDPLLTATAVYARLIDLGLERGWITPEQLARSIDGDPRVLKVAESDAQTFSLAKALSDQVDHMSSEDLQHAFRILRERQKRMRAVLERQAQSETILAPREIGQFDIEVPFAFREKSRLSLIPRENEVPLIAFKTARHTKVIDPLMHNESEPGATSEFGSDNTIITPDGRLLFTFTKPAGGYQFWVRDLLDPAFSRRIHTGYPLPHQWHLTPNGRVFLIETNDLSGAEISVYEYTGDDLKKIFSKTMKFVAFLSNEKGDLRVLGKVGTSDYFLYDPIAKKRLWEWKLSTDFTALQPFLSREGVTYLKIFDAKKGRGANGFSRRGFCYFFFKEGEREPVAIQKADSKNSEWHQLQDGRVVYPLSTFENEQGQISFGLIEPFPESADTAPAWTKFWRELLKKPKAPRIWDSDLKSPLPAERAKWTARDEYRFEKDRAFFTYRWENNRMVLKSRVEISFSPTQLHEFQDLQTDGDKLILALDQEHAVLARSSSGALPSTSIQPGIFSDVLVDHKMNMTYAAVSEHPTESVFRVHLYELYKKRERK